MLRKIFGLSSAIIVASCLIENSSYAAVAVHPDKLVSESSPSHLIAQARTYRVTLGDTLGGIANRNGIRLSQILNYNPHLRSRPNLIYVGEIINLGGGNAVSVATPTPSGRKYTVRSGDTLGGIAIRHGLSLKTIIAYNPQLASRINRINVGEQINVGSAQIIRQARTSRPTIRPTTSPSPAPTSPAPTSPAPTSPTPTSTTPASIEPRRAVAFGNLPNERRSGSDNIGSKRGPGKACTEARENMRAIAPQNGLQYTFEDYPYFFWYFPGIESDTASPPKVEFILMSRETKEVNGRTRDRYVKVYDKELNLDRSGIIAFTVPAAESAPLEEAKEYKWRIRIQCDHDTAMNLSYSIQRKSTDNPELISKLENAPVDRHPLIFAESGVWFDALKIIALQLEQAPEDPILTEDWNNVLKLIGFEDLIGQPIQYIDADVE